MTRLLISTASRHNPHNQPSGHLICYDMAERRVVRVTEIIEPPYREENPNPRGGLRGLKGISYSAGRLAIANASTVFFYDREWNPLSYFFHPSCAGIHDIDFAGDTLWVTSTRNDLLLQMDLHGKILQAYDARGFARTLGVKTWQPKPYLNLAQIQSGQTDFRDPRTHDEVFSDSGHLNSVARFSNGDLVFSLGQMKQTNHLRMLALKSWLVRRGLWGSIENTNRWLRGLLHKKASRHNGELVFQPARGLSALLRLQPDGHASACLVLPGASVPSHSVRELRDGSAIYLHTPSGELVHFNPQTGAILSRTLLGEKFLRGARQLPDGTLVLGDSNRLVHFDLERKEVLFSDLISENPAEAIFDLYVLPDEFDLPPESFVEHHRRLLPVQQV